MGSADRCRSTCGDGATDQALADQHTQNLTVRRGHTGALVSDQIRQGREVRLRITAHRDVQEILATRPLDAPRTHQTLRLRQQNNLQQHLR